MYIKNIIKWGIICRPKQKRLKLVFKNTKYRDI